MTLKSLLFGSAAIIAAGTGAQAADLPTAEPVEYVRICDAFGTGFYYIPGTDTCLKVSGQVRAEAHYVFSDEDDDDGDDDGDFFGNDGVEFNNFTTRARGNVRLDARTQTDFGLIRAFIDLQMTVGPGETSGDGTVDAGDQNYAGAGSDLSAAFIQITNDMGTFTAGHTGSFFDFFGSYDFGTRLDIDDNTTEQTLFAYTFGGGNGFSFTVSAEDPASSGRRLEDLDDYEGQQSPDGVFNVRVDQGWGSAQVMGVVGEIHDGTDDDDDSALGWAVGAGLSTKLPFLGGLELSAQGGYAEGRLGYISTDPGDFGDFSGPDADDTTEGWNVRAGVRGHFTEKVTASVSGSFTHVERSDLGIAGESEEYEFWAINGNVIYSPVEGLIMGPEIAYQNIEFDDSDNDDDSFDDDRWGAMFRIQRSF